MYLYFSSLSPFLSYTIGSGVKQAALQKVCSSLTPRLQTHSGQDEEKEREERVEREAPKCGREGGVCFGLLRWIALLHACLYSNRAKRRPLLVGKLAWRVKRWLKLRKRL